MKRLILALFILYPSTSLALSRSCPVSTPALIDAYHDLWHLCVDLLKEERTRYLVCAAQIQMQYQIRGIAVSPPAAFIVSMSVASKLPQSTLCNFTAAIAYHRACEQTRALVAAHRQACEQDLDYSENITGIESW